MERYHIKIQNGKNAGLTYCGLDTTGTFIFDSIDENQIKEIVAEVSKIIPIKLETKKVKIIVPAMHTGKAYGVITPYKEEEKWLDNGDLQVKLSEGIFIGYRHFDKNNIEPLFPFGYGLSYTSFEYLNLQLSEKELTETGSIKISFTLKNVGDYDGAEVVQLYISDSSCQLVRKPKTCLWE